MEVNNEKNITRKLAYFVGVDLGQAFDPTAIAVVERETCEVADNADRREGARTALHLPPTVYRIRHLERLALGTTYPRQVQYVQELLRREPLASHHASTYLDGTGVGRAVVDLFKQARMRRMYPVTRQSQWT